MAKLTPNKPRLNLSECTGKTIAALATGQLCDCVVLVFEDGYVALCTRRGYDDTEIVELEEGDMYEHNLEFIEAGLLTQEQVLEYANERERERVAGLERRDLADYERLRKKFGQ